MGDGDGDGGDVDGPDFAPAIPTAESSWVVPPPASTVFLGPDYQGLVVLRSSRQPRE